MLLHSVIRAHLIGVKPYIKVVQSSSRGPTKLELQSIPYCTYSGVLFKFSEQVVVHAAQHCKAHTTVFLKLDLVGFSITKMLTSIAFLRSMHLLGQSLQNLLLIENVLDFVVPHVIIVAIQFLSLVQVSHDTLISHLFMRMNIIRYLVHNT